MPGVQNPHCSPWHSMKPCCTGSSRPYRSSPSTVRTACPSAIAASSVHDLTGLASSHTTQLPQLEVSQPQWLPVSPSSSRRKWMSSSRGSTSRAYSVPLTVIAILIVTGRPSRQGPGGGAAQGAGGEFGDQVALEVLGAALVGGGVAVLGGDFRGFGGGVLAGGTAAQVVLGLGGDEVLGADRGQAEARFFYGVVLELQHGPGRGDRPVADPAGHLLVRAAGAGPQRDPDLGQQLAPAHHRLVGAAVELPDRDRALAVLAGYDRGGAGRGERGGQVLGRIRLGPRPRGVGPQPEHPG